MNGMIRKSTAGLLAASIAISAAAVAYADENEENISKEEIIYELLDQYWVDSPVGTKNPECSLEYRILTVWLDENYGKSNNESGVWRWYKMYDIQEAYREYYEDFTKEWHYNDDEDTGEFTIDYYDPETEKTGDKLYRFELIDGMWHMIDMNGNTVDIFEPHGGNGLYDESEDNTERIDALIKRMGGNNNNTTANTNEPAEENEKPHNDQDSSSRRNNNEPAEAANEEPGSGDSTTGNENTPARTNNNGARVTGKATTAIADDSDDESSTSDDTSKTADDKKEKSKSSSDARIWILSAFGAIVGVLLGTRWTRKKKVKEDDD